MKVLLVNTNHYLGGGDSTYTFNLAQLLKDNGHIVAFFAMQDTRNLPDPNKDLFVSYIDYKELNHRKNLITGLKVIFRSIYSIEARKKFHKLLKRINPDIIHLNNIHHHITPSIIFEAKERNLSVIWTLHDYKLLCPNTHFLIDSEDILCENCRPNKYYRAVLKQCKKNSFLASIVITLESYTHRFLKIRDKIDYFITPSLFLEKKLIDYGFVGYKIKHIPHFIPDYYFKKSLDNDGYFLYIGKLSKIKGIDVLIEACRIIPECRLLIAGDGEKRIKEAMLLNLSPNVKYLGQQNREQVQELIEKSIAVILPSLWYENQPFCILEAFAKGKPVITSNLGGLKELVGHNERGLLVPPGEPKALAEAMDWILRHTGEAKKMGETAYEYVRQEHSPEKHYNELMNVYKEVLK